MGHAKSSSRFVSRPTHQDEERSLAALGMIGVCLHGIGCWARDLDFAGSSCCDLLRSPKNRTMPARTERTLAVWALDIPKKERGLMRTISTRKRAMPVKIR